MPMTFGAAFVTLAAAALATSGAIAQHCDIHEIVSAEDPGNTNDFTLINLAAMNSSGSVVISVSELTDPFEGDDISRILLWSTDDPDADPTANPLVDTGARATDYNFAINATINDLGDIIFVGNTDIHDTNVFNLAGDPQLTFPNQQPTSIGELVLLDKTDLTFLYWQVSANGAVEHCVKRNDGAVDLCGSDGIIFVSPDGNNADDVYLLRIEPDVSRQIINAAGVPICTIQSSGVLTRPSVNAHGNVAFYSSQSCDGSGDTAGEGIYWYDAAADQLTRVVDFTDPILDLSVPFLVPRPLLNDADRIAFVAQQGTSSRSGDFSIFLYSEVNAGRVLKLNDGADPNQPRALFGYMVDPDDPSGDTDRLLYRAVNAEGRQTLFLASGCAYELTVEPCPADLNGDGTVDGGDLLILLSAWGPNPGHPADFNGDDDVDGADLLILLGEWGTCPGFFVCGESGSGDCCEPGSSTSCDDEACCEFVCGLDPFCCDVAWDDFCAATANEHCLVCGAPAECGVVGTGDCCVAQSDSPFCDDADCCALICADDPFCCNVNWDSLCADAANDECDVCEPAACLLPGWDVVVGQPGLRDGGLLAMTAFDNALVVGGWFTSAGDHDDAQGFAWWDGSQWHLPTWLDPISTVAGGEQFTGHFETGALKSLALNDVDQELLAFSLNVFPLNVMASDFFTSIGLLPGLDEEPVFFGNADGDVFVMEVFNDGPAKVPALYVGGQFTEIDGVAAFNIARWDWDGNWSQPFSLDFGLDDPIVSPMFDLRLHDVDGEEALYFSHYTITARGEHSVIGKWDGSDVTVIGYVQGQIWSLEVFDGELHIGGDFSEVLDSIPGAGAGVDPGVQANNVARWDGKAWSALDAGLDLRVFTFGVFDDGSGEALYAGGSFSGGDEQALLIYRWDGQSWSTLNDTGPFHTGAAPRVNLMEVFDDGLGPGLYIGGSFTSIFVKGDEPDQAASGLDEVEVGQIAAWRCLDDIDNGNGDDR